MEKSNREILIEGEHHLIEMGKKDIIEITNMIHELRSAESLDDAHEIAEKLRVVFGRFVEEVGDLGSTQVARAEEKK